MTGLSKIVPSWEIRVLQKVLWC